MFKRSSGILLHLSSLPSIGGIGDFGPAAYDFVDFLKNAKQRYWQILPLNPTDLVYGNGPYSSLSAFALNTLFISLELLVKDGFLTKEELDDLTTSKWEDRVDYFQVIEAKSILLEQAFERFEKTKVEEHQFVEFCKEHNFWLDAYADFMVAKKCFRSMIWSDWPQDLRSAQPQRLSALRSEFARDIVRIKFFQYLAFKQWFLLRGYCQSRGVEIVGDIPIYVNEDSADVWSNSRVFKLDENLKPVFVAGVPPDYFSKTGQRWGNPVYDWQYNKATNYQWWTQRIKHNLHLFDVIRIDHFRGLMEYWEIPAAEKTAINGRWVPGPGEDFLSHLRVVYPDLPIIAEDLGLITPDVGIAMKKFDLPGMKILLFAFGEDLTHIYLPENFTEPCVVYTGTHDNNTTRGWFRRDATAQEQEFLVRYTHKNITEDNVAGELIRVALKSPAVIAIIPMQDILNLDENSRMNTPGTVLGNWEWRLQKEDLTQALADQLAQITVQSQR
jgi:4-alpha-glucanotransferase